MDYTIETVKGNEAAIDELTKLHYKELAPYDDIPLNINWTRYLNLERAGILKFYAAREEDKLVGYSIFLVSSSLEYSTSIQAHLNNLFVHPEYRGKSFRFISWCDQRLKELGVQVVYHHVKSRNDYGVLLKRIGYERMNITYAKRLD